VGSSSDFISLSYFTIALISSSLLSTRMFSEIEIDSFSTSAASAEVENPIDVVPSIVKHKNNDKNFLPFFFFFKISTTIPLPASNSKTTQTAILVLSPVVGVRLVLSAAFSVVSLFSVVLFLFPLSTSDFFSLSVPPPVVVLPLFSPIFPVLPELSPVSGFSVFSLLSSPVFGLSSPASDSSAT